MAKDKDTDLHPLANEGKDPLEGHAKRPELVKAPVVTTNPTSETQRPDKPKVVTFDDIDLLGDKIGLDAEVSQYPLAELEAGGAVLIQADAANSVDALVEKLNKQVYAFNQRYGVQEVDENGDRISNQVIIHTRKKNDDGTFQIRANGELIEGADHSFKPQMAYIRKYVVKPVTKDYEVSKGNKVPHDGVLVIRLW